jgi:uncharacterized protein YcgI (DUF1989 family)
MKFVVARDIGSACDDLRIYAGLLAFTTAYRDDPKLFQSFVVVFEQPAALSEDQFEAALWTRVQSLTDKHAWHFLLTPCSKDTFRIIYGDETPHRGCFGNLVEALAPYGIAPDQIPTAFNVFMNVTIDGEGRLTVEPPLSRAGDHILFEAELDLIVALTACSALQSNNYAFKPIRYEIIDVSPA